MESLSDVDRDVPIAIPLLLHEIDWLSVAYVARGFVATAIDT